MLLTETINNSIMAINARRVTIESKQKAATYVKALTKLGQVEKSLKNSIECAKAMKSSGIVDETLMDDPTKQDLLDCINDCGKAVSDV